MILDASALLAWLFKEPGQDRVLAAVIAGAEMTSVNFTEVGTVYLLRGFPADAVGACTLICLSLWLRWMAILPCVPP